MKACSPGCSRAPSRRSRRPHPRDAAALAALHVASFNRGWSEHEFEQLLTDRNVIADRAASGRRNVGFILSRRAADEAEILSVAVARVVARARDLRAGCSICTCAVSPGSACARCSSRWTRTTRRRAGFTRARGFARSAAVPAIMRKSGGNGAALVLRRDLV